MGSFVTVYTVDFDRIEAEIGCGEAALAQRYATAFTQDNDELQEMVHFQLEDEDERDITLADVARHMIMGEPYDERIGFAYGYFLEHLCQTHGTRINSNAWAGVQMAYCEQVDKVLGDAGLLADGFTVWDLLFGGSPVDLPIEDFPAIGYREPGTMAEPARRLARAATAHIDERYKAAAYDVFQWLARADDSGHCLVTFYS